MFAIRQDNSYLNSGIWHVKEPRCFPRMSLIWDGGDNVSVCLDSVWTLAICHAGDKRCASCCAWCWRKEEWEEGKTRWEEKGGGVTSSDRLKHFYKENTSTKCFDANKCLVTMSMFTVHAYDNCVSCKHLIWDIYCSFIHACVHVDIIMKGTRNGSHCSFTKMNCNK